MLEIKNLQVGVEDNAILKGVDLSIQPGETHAIMGPNGSGKSTLAQVLAGMANTKMPHQPPASVRGWLCCRRSSGAAEFDKRASRLAIPAL